MTGSPSQSQGRDKNGAIPPGRPDASTSEAAIVRNGERSRRSAGPDGPEATVVGDTFKSSPGGSVMPGVK